MNLRKFVLSNDLRTFWDLSRNFQCCSQYSRLVLEKALEIPVFLWSKITLWHGFFSKVNASFGSLLHFLIQLKSHLLTVNQWQVCFPVDSCSSDMDHRRALLAVLEHLEHLVWFQKPIWVDCLFPFQKIKQVLDTGAKFALWYATLY